MNEIQNKKPRLVLELISPYVIAVTVAIVTFILTFVLKPKTTQSLVHLNMALSVAIAKALASYDVGIKWPNDFIKAEPCALGNKKVGGILIEGVWKAGKIEGLIVGIAINSMNEFSPDDPLYDFATSLKTASQSAIDNERLRESLFQSLDSWYKRWQEGNFGSIFSAWKESQGYLGKEICVHRKDRTLICGVMKDVTESGDLVLVGQDGCELEIPFCLVERVEPDFK